MREVGCRGRRPSGRRPRSKGRRFRIRVLNEEAGVNLQIALDVAAGLLPLPPVREHPQGVPYMLTEMGTWSWAPTSAK
jgi:hypothetical protein